MLTKLCHGLLHYDFIIPPTKLRFNTPGSLSNNETSEIFSPHQLIYPNLASIDSIVGFLRARPT